uniref:Putative reverse transcriptase domain-containing protein n=1 Tax=Tanacetum cinerariifolium TaxID=118510 RepID=A0A6L2J307_TANCI|nr:putative reverse transcriptase domain-containing protein [Tanacetum cinerariifolium]
MDLMNRVCKSYLDMFVIMLNDVILIYFKSKKDHEIAKPLTSLTQKNHKCEWGAKQEEAFQTLNDKLCNALILSLPDGPDNFVEMLKTKRDRQKSYVDNRHKPLEFEVGDQVLLKEPPWKGVMRFGKGKLSPRENQFVEEPVEIMDREVKRLKRSKIPIVKVRWNSKRGPELTWECEHYLKAKGDTVTTVNKSC